MSIIKDKINTCYTKDELEKIFPKFIFSYLTTNKKRNTPPLYEISKFIDINRIGYILKDFIEDYPHLDSFKEIATVLNIYSSGISIQGYAAEKGMVKKGLPTILKEGFFYNSLVLNKIIDIAKIEYNMSDFKIEYHESHLELYGEKEKLIEFKNLYNLEESIYYEIYKNSWHLAFRGLLAEYIRSKEKKKET